MDDDKKDFNKHLEQIIDILIYDFNNKYLTLKYNGIPMEKINTFMDDYEKTRINTFKNDIKVLKNIYRNRWT